MKSGLVALSALLLLTACNFSGENPDYQPVSQLEAVRFLNQATFGAETTSINDVSTQGFEFWIDSQFKIPSAYSSTPASGTDTHINLMMNAGDARGENFSAPRPEAISGMAARNRREQLSAWWELALFAPDQLRHRMAFAMSELLVVSTSQAPLNWRSDAIAFYADILARNAFGNYRTLLDEIARSMPMGVFLSMQGNEKGDPTTGRSPDENFAREVMQLFTIGLFELNLDGTPVLDGNGKTIPTYTQTDVEEMARVMTGWSRQVRQTGETDYDLKASRFGRINISGGYYAAYMECHNDRHDVGSKLVLGVTIPAGQSCDQDLADAIDILMSHPNMGPFVAKHLIRRFVTSNPSPAYVQRVAQVFNNNGNDIKGDLAATLKALLLDAEARTMTNREQPNFGRIKNPIEAAAQMYRALNPIVPTGYARVLQLFVEPTGSFTVFNFYESDFIPSHPDFVNENLHAPESQILNDSDMAKYYNWYDRVVRSKEVRERVFNSPEKLEPGIRRGTGLFAEDTDHWNRNDVHIDLKPQLELVYQALNNNYENMNDITLRNNATDLLIDNLNMLLLEGRLSSGFKDDLKTYLATLNYGDNEQEAIFMVQDAVLMIVTSPYFAVQK